MALETFVVHKEWLDSIASMPVDAQDKIIAEFVRYGCGLSLEHTDDVMVQSFVNLLKNRIDYSKDQYEKKVSMSKTAGAKKKVNDRKIYEMAREGKTSKEIAIELGLSKSSIDHSDGWRNRNEEEFIF